MRCLSGEALISNMAYDLFTKLPFHSCMFPPGQGLFQTRYPGLPSGSLLMAMTCLLLMMRWTVSSLDARKARMKRSAAAMKWV
jgi:hypothetical protein